MRKRVEVSPSHGPQGEALGVLVVGVAQDEHAVAVVIPVAGDLIEVPLGHEGGLGEQIAALLLGVFHPSLQLLDHPGALGQQDGQALADDVHGGEVFQLPAQLVVIPLQGFSLLLQIGVQLFLGGEGHAVDALQHLPVGVAAPVGAAGLGELEAVVLDPARGIQVRTGAEVGELALGVEGDDRVLRQVVDELHLVGLALGLHVGDGLGSGLLGALQVQALLADLLHLGLDLLQVLVGEGEGGVKVVVPAQVDGGADGQLHLGPQTLDGLRHDVGAGVPIGLAVGFVFEGVEIFFGHCIFLLTELFSKKHP